MDHGPARRVLAHLDILGHLDASHCVGLGSSWELEMGCEEFVVQSANGSEVQRLAGRNGMWTDAQRRGTAAKNEDGDKKIFKGGRQPRYAFYI